MKAGIWGTGNVAATHAEALKAAGIQIGAVVDVDSGKARSFAQKWGADSHGTEEGILFAEDITTVHVCTPPNLHYEMVMKLLNAGKHVLCEKPLCFEDAQAEELARTAREKGLVCAINFNVRFHMACQRAKEVVSTEDFGPVLLVHGNYLQEFNAFPAPLDWRYNPVLAGRMRAVTEIGTHWMDIAQYISGKKITAVSALFGNFHPQRILEDGIMYRPGTHEGGEPFQVISEDAATVNIRFADGAIGCAIFSEISPGRINRITLEVTGTDGSLWWNSEDNNMLHTAKKGGGVNTQVFGFGNGFADTFRTLLTYFYEDVKAGKAPATPVYPGFDEGAWIVKLCNSLLKSADQGGAWVGVEG